MNSTLVAQRLKQIAVCIEELTPLLPLSAGEFRTLPAHFRLAERDIQLVVDSAIDINNHLILGAGQAPPDRYYETFLMVEGLKILPHSLALRLARSTGLRNRIVHEYERVDLHLVHRSLPAFLRDYSEYVRIVRKRLPR